MNEEKQKQWSQLTVDKNKSWNKTKKNGKDLIRINYLVVQRFQLHALNWAPVRIRSYFVIFSIDHLDLVTSLWTHLIQYYSIKHYLFHSYRQHHWDWEMRVICCCWTKETWNDTNMNKSVTEWEFDRFLEFYFSRFGFVWPNNSRLKANHCFGWLAASLKPNALTERERL